jgi:hypothetical protein
LKRRELLTSMAASAAAIGSLPLGLRGAEKTESLTNGREYYQLRRYQLRSGPQSKLVNSYLGEALIPGLNRLGIKPVGVFSQEIGAGNPAIYVLIPSMSVDLLSTVDLHLERDAEYLKAGERFLQAPATEPAYERLETSLLLAFEGHPKMTVSSEAAHNSARVFELRTYESPSDRDHRRKIEMFHNGEFDIFQRAGFSQVFYGDTLAGPRMPNLTYMIGFDGLSERDAKWKAFFSDPDWKKLSANPKFAFESIVSNVNNYILTPAAYSQI